ncbi:hypothetical protein G5714_019404 [Onychostoma macrolepis]|uniref:Uncharacterized protein n=1 Tax=Onychostoma macrolepis TaxID=369639 RepID=A0A7J6BWC9_9TELE|nr:hypothetical protein G5714_019404 [Onychostoma macrolepis]
MGSDQGAHAGGLISGGGGTTPMRHDPNEKPIGRPDKINLLESILRKEQCFLSACTHVQRQVKGAWEEYSCGKTIPGGQVLLTKKSDSGVNWSHVPWQTVAVPSPTPTQGPLYLRLPLCLSAKATPLRP